MPRLPKIAILSDIHSNLPALQAVLREVSASGAEVLYVAGDTLGFAAWPRECFELVQKIAAGCVLGNQDEHVDEVLRTGIPATREWKGDSYLEGIVHSAKHLNSDLAASLRRLPMTLKIPGGIMAHASLDDPGAWNYIESREAAWPTLLALRELTERIGFFGHTHQQELFPDPDAAEGPEQLDPLRWRLPEGLACAVTVGSVGQSRITRDQRAAWTLWDPRERMVAFRRTEYDNLAAAKAIIGTGLPRETASVILHPDQEKAKVTWREVRFLKKTNQQTEFDLQTKFILLIQPFQYSIPFNF
jgi:predicted phosphodiesterase